MSDISLTAVRLSIACLLASITTTSTATVNEKKFSYPHSSPVATLKLVNTPVKGIEHLHAEHASAGADFSISTDSSHRALFRPGNVLSLHTQSNQSADSIVEDLQLGAASAGETWVSGNTLNKNARDFIRYVSDLDQHGLNPNRYNIGELKALADARTLDNADDATRLLNRTFEKVAHAMGSGIVDPTVSQKEWDREADSIDPAPLLDQLKRGLMDVDSVFASIEPQDARYQSLKDMLQALMALDPSEQIFVEANETLIPDAEHESVLQLKQALLATGDLKEGRTLSNVYDTDLEMAVQRFQLRHGLKTDGLMGKKTLTHLNTPIEDRIAQVRSNLERWRWFPAQLEESHLMVNIPEYRVRMIHGKEQLFEMDIVVGKPKHMTPVFSETMKYVEFAPTWTVPASITNDELIPIEKRSPGYLQREEIDFFVRGSNGLRRIDRSRVTADTLNQRPFPYILRQRAGAKNVLGKVKFLFPNKYAVYMHDTQAKKLFGEPQRAFSHGCIRLSNPDLMAYVIMQLDGHQQSEVNDLMALTETTQVKLDTRIPVHMAYFTAWQDEYGMMHFRKDIYKQDERLNKALDAKQGKLERMALAE